MLHIDSLNKLALSLEDIRRMSSGRISDVGAFEKFAGGVRLDEEFLSNDRWGGQTLTNGTDMFNLVLHEMLPTVYDATYLEKIGGSVSIRIAGVGDYTMIAVCGRVVTLSGAVVDGNTGEEYFDFEIAPDVFMGFCRTLLLEMADNILEADDEWEDRVVPDAELMLNGMPTGGRRTNEAESSTNEAEYGNYSYGGCALDASVFGTYACSGDLWVCGGNASAAVAFGCATNAYGCDGNASAAGISLSGANVSGCGVNANACGANINTGACVAYAVACGVDLGWAVDYGVCAVNIIPAVPSC